MKKKAQKTLLFFKNTLYEDCSQECITFGHAYVKAYDASEK